MGADSTSSVSSTPPVDDACEGSGPGDAAWTWRDALYGAALGWLFPRRAALQTWNGPLALAWKFHFGISLFFLVFLAMLIPWMAHGRPMEFIDDLTRAFYRDFWVKILFVGLTVVGFEGGFVALAMVVMPWGCRDEPLGRSFANSLRQTWLHTFHGVPAILIVCLLVMWQSQARESFRSVYGNPYDHKYIRAGNAYARSSESYGVRITSPPQPPASAAPDSAEMLEYRQKMNQYDQELGQRVAIVLRNALYAYEREQPSLLRYSDPLIALVICLLGAWMLWSLIRAVTAPRPVVDEVERDPTCENCGYNLRLMPMDRRCPECGLAVVESLGEGARPGPPLMQRSVGWWRGYWRTVGRAVFRPRRLGRMLPTRTPMRGHGVVYAVHLLVWFAAVATTASLFEYWETVQRVGRMRLHYSTLSFMAARNIEVASYWLLGLIGAIGLVAFLVTVYAWWRGRRNLGQVAMVMASYASGLLVAWTLAMCAVVLAILWSETGQKILGFFDIPYVDPGWVLLWIGVLVAARVLLGYAVAVWKGTLAARWGNR